MSSNRPGLEPAEKGFYSEIFNQNYKKQTERGPDVIQNLQVRTICRFLAYLLQYHTIVILHQNYRTFLTTTGMGRGRQPGRKTGTGTGNQDQKIRERDSKF